MCMYTYMYVNVNVYVRTCKYIDAGPFWGCCVCLAPSEGVHS